MKLLYRICSLFLAGIVLFFSFASQTTYAAVLPSTIYLSNTASAKITATTSWQFVTTAPSSANTTTSVKQAKNTNYFQWQPNVSSNSTNATSAPTIPSGKGFIYDTALDSTIPTGTWTFNVRTTASSATGTGHVVVCAWKVTVSGGSIASNATIFPSSAACAEGSTNIMTSTSILASSVSVANVAATSFSSSQYLYVEYWLRMTSAGSSSTATTSFEANGGSSDDIVLPGSSSDLAPNIPTQNSPANNATAVSTTPNFLITAADPESDSLGYKVTIYSNSGCTNIVNTFDQSSSATGWTGTNATCTHNPTSCYTSGTQGNFTVQAANALSAGTSYWWKGSAKDPDGSGSFTDSSTCNTFQTAGSLTMTTPTSASLNAVTLAASAQNGTGSLGTITVNDTRGTNVGWTLTASSTNFTVSTHTIAVTNFNVNPGSVTLISGSLTGVSAGNSHTFTSTSDSATLMSASSGNGNGSYSVNPSLTLTVPVGSYAGSYTATITETVQ